MKKAKRIPMAVCLLVLVALWWYWERPVPLDELLPDETWVGMELEQMCSANLAGDLEYIDPPMDAVLELLPGIRVTRAEGRPYLEDSCFRITLYKGESWPTVLYVGSTGRVDIAADMQFDNWKYYEGGEALYQYLSNLSKTLSAVFPADKP